MISILWIKKDQQKEIFLNFKTVSSKRINIWNVDKLKEVWRNATINIYFLRR